jgi:integral membrane sensor domain MASE1
MTAALRRILGLATAAYGGYAAFLLVEVLDFLALLRAPPQGMHATYDIVDVAFFMVEFIVCGLLALVFLTLSLAGRPGWPLAAACAALTLGRACLGWYLYLHIGSAEQITPFIYKDANAFSGMARMIFVPTQVVLGVVAVASAGRQKASTPD